MLWALLLATAAAFWPALTGPFVFDDFPNLENLRQLEGRIDRDSVGLYLYSFVGNPGRPLAALSFLIEDASWPTSPEAFKRNNVLFHLLCGCLVFLLTRNLATEDTRSAPLAPWIALACTAMWLLHPFQVSTTMLVVQRMTVLSAFFVLCGLLLYLRALSAQRLPPFWRVALAGTALAVFGVVAFLCKENGVLVFAYAIVLNATLLGDRLRALPALPRRLLLWGSAAPMLLLVVLAALRIDGIVAEYAFRDFTLGQRLLTECRILLGYLGSILLPRLQGNGIFHDDYAVSRSLLDPATTLPAVLAVAALLGSALWLRRRAPLYAFAVLWFLIGHSIESSVIALELYFEHRNYLPMIGPLFALASLLLRAQSRHRVAAISILCVWLAAAATSTRLDATIWGDRGRIAQVWAQQSPGSPRAIQMLASYYADSGDTLQARKVLDAGIRRLPQKHGLQMQRITLDCLERGVTRGQWRDMLRLAALPGYDRALPTLATAFVQQVVDAGNCHGTVSHRDVRDLVMAVMHNPAYADDDSQGYLHYELSRLALVDRDLDLLMRHMELSNRYRPNPLVVRDQAIFLLTAGLPREALARLDASEQAPIPLFKRWLLDMPSRNASLRASAERMQAQISQK